MFTQVKVDNNKVQRSFFEGNKLQTLYKLQYANNHNQNSYKLFSDWILNLDKKKKTAAQFNFDLEAQHK